MDHYLWLLGPACLLLLLAYLHLKERDGNWHEAGNGVMRRFRNGRFETRPMRQEETEAWQNEQW